MPFFKATCVYFVLWLPTSSPSWFSALIKCLPIFCLWVFLLAHGFTFLCAHSSARKILAGLIFSALGDAFLIWQEQGYFVHGEEKLCILTIISSYVMSRCVHLKKMSVVNIHQILTDITPGSGIVLSPDSSWPLGLLSPLKTLIRTIRKTK